MKVFVLIGAHNYEGYSEPEGIYSSRQLAEAAKPHIYPHYDDIEVQEYELDGKTKWSSQ
jgi:hypothetical protein